ncbi:hypothetical protein [Cobetia crustatorum]|uniref:Uncharacterized protein n=1 Tax=Cobetia crustatorum TaxID=553385 RepID=A0A558HHS6_9GAMM|nr:hypothetical protein [Cobetia crustatorum]TVU68692.1 hypothetical protein FQP86_12915 [Cobetia crustatorum]
MMSTAEVKKPLYQWDESFYEDLISDTTGAGYHRFFSDSSGSKDLMANFPELAVKPIIERDSESVVVRQLNKILTVFGLTKTQMAQVCGVTRRAYYSWILGAEPRQDALCRIKLLYRAASDWERSGYTNPAAVINVGILKEKSLMSYLEAENLDLDAIHFIGSRLKVDEVLGSSSELDNPF